MNIVFNGLSVYLPTGKTFSATNHLIPELTNKGISVFTLTKVNEQLYRLNPKSPNQTSVPQMYIYDVRYR
jgi:spore germination protein YaaH